MALLDPSSCVSLPFDGVARKLVGSEDEREADNEDQPLTPLTPLTPTTPTTPPSPHSVLSNSLNPSSVTSMHSHPHHSQPQQSHSGGGLLSSSPPSSPPPPHGALPTVIQSMISYIFPPTDSSHSLSPHAPSPRSPPPSLQQPPPLSPLSPPPSSSLPPSPSSSSLSPSSLLFSSTFPLISSTASSNPPSLPSTPLHHSTSPSSSPLHVTSSPVSPLSPSNGPTGNGPSSLLLKPSGRQCAILDLDETLLHSFFPDKVTPYQYQYMVMKCRAQEAEEKEGKIRSDERTLYQVDVGDGTLVVLILRPHLRPFLQRLFASFDVGVWSAGGKLYVDAICRVLFPSQNDDNNEDSSSSSSSTTASSTSTPLCRPLFQLCWDDVQVETNGLSSYTKPLTTLIARYSHLSLSNLFLVDNRKENGLHFPSQLVIAPDYLPRPWEWNGEKDRDVYLMDQCMTAISDCVEAMKGQAKRGREEEGDESMEEEEEEEEESEMGLEEEEEEVVEEEEEDVEGEEEEGEGREEEVDESEMDDSAGQGRVLLYRRTRGVAEEDSDDLMGEEEEEEGEESVVLNSRSLPPLSIAPPLPLLPLFSPSPNTPTSANARGRGNSQKAAA